MNPVLYAYISKENKAFIKQLQKENNRSLSFVTDEMISSIREKRKFNVTKATPKFVEKAEDWKKAREV